MSVEVITRDYWVCPCCNKSLPKQIIHSSMNRVAEDVDWVVQGKYERFTVAFYAVPIADSKEYILAIETQSPIKKAFYKRSFSVENNSCWQQNVLAVIQNDLKKYLEINIKNFRDHYLQVVTVVTPSQA